MRVIVIGAGETGIALARRFSASGDVVLIDRDPAALRQAEEQLDVMPLEGEATHPTVLATAGVASAQAVVAVTGSDTNNLLSAALAKVGGASLSLARVDDPAFYRTTEAIEHDVLGVESVLCATRLASSAMVSRMISMDASFSETFCGHGIRVGLFAVTKDSPLSDRRPENLEFVDQVALAGVVRDGFLRAPSEVPRFIEGDAALIAGDADAFIDQWIRMIPGRRRNRCVIVGGGHVGAQLAKLLCTRFERLELIEIGRERAEVLSASLTDVTVVAGDARKSEFLKDLQVGSADHLLVVTADDEINLLVSLLGRKLGVAHTFTILREPGRVELFGELGIEGAISSYDVLAKTVHAEAMAWGLTRSVVVPGTAYSIFEWRLPKETPGNPRTLAAIPLPPMARPIGVARRARFLWASRDQTIEGRDSILIVAPTREARALERALTGLGKD